MQFVDTHCHIHEAQFELSGDAAMRAVWLRTNKPDPDDMIERAVKNGVTQMICVGTNVADSKLAADFVQNRPGCWASIGLHPHEAKDGEPALRALEALLSSPLISASTTPRPANASPQAPEAPSGPEGRASQSRAASTLASMSGKGNLRDEARGVATETNANLKDSPQTSPRASSLRHPSPQVLAGLPAARQRGTSVDSRGLSTFSLIPEGEDDKASGPLAATASSESSGWQAELGERGIHVTAARKIVAIGECGLDYHYNNSPKKAQIKALRFQIELAIRYNLPLIFHVRSAFDDFWPIFDSYQNIRGVLHSYTDSHKNLEKALARNLYIGANGIMTFTKDISQLDMIKSVPLQKLLVETDAPFLTPEPFRGNVNEPAHVKLVATFLAELRGESIHELAHYTSNNAQTLFNLHF